MPPKPIELTDIQRQEVETLAALLNQEQIADYLGIARNTFRAICDRDPDVAERYKRGKAKAIAHVAQGLLQKARGGCTPSFDVNAERTSVSGLSSGAYLAGQFHVAFSGTLIGAGIVAGGPYGCAEGQLPVALNRCMQTGLGVPDPARLLDHAQAFVAEGDIDPLAGLADDRVYVFSGTEDETVTPPVVVEVEDFYRLAGIPDEALRVVDDIEAGHAFITEDRGNACDVTRTPFSTTATMTRRERSWSMCTAR